MNTEKPVSFRMDVELLGMLDAEAARRKWSRSATIHDCVQIGLMELRREDGVVAPARTTAAKSRGGAVVKKIAGAAALDVEQLQKAYSEATFPDPPTDVVFGVEANAAVSKQRIEGGVGVAQGSEPPVVSAKTGASAGSSPAPRSKPCPSCGSVGGVHARGCKR